AGRLERLRLGQDVGVRNAARRRDLEAARPDRIESGELDEPRREPRVSAARDDRALAREELPKPPGLFQANPPDVPSPRRLVTAPEPPPARNRRSADSERAFYQNRARRHNDSLAEART